MDGELSHLDIKNHLEKLCRPHGVAATDTGGNKKTDPTGQIFRALFDIDGIQELQSGFSAATRVASIITTPTGLPITGESNFCDLCRIIRKKEKGLLDCRRLESEIGRYNPEGPTIQRCVSGGLWDAGVAITADGIHLANWVIGQVRDERADKDGMRAYALEIGADVEEFISAFEHVPAMPLQQFEQVSRALYLTADQMSQRAHQILQQTDLLGRLDRLEGIIRRSPAVAFHWRKEDALPVDFVTENVKTLLGYAPDDFTGSGRAFSQTIHMADRERFMEEIKKNTDNKGVMEFSHAPYRIVARTGEAKWVHTVTRINRDPEGEATGYEGWIVDITECKRMQDEKEALESHLQRAQKMELIGMVAGGVAHDLNNILGAFVGLPDLLIMDLPHESPLRRPLEEIKRSGMKAADIVQDLLTLARRGVVVRKVVNLNATVRDYLRSPEHRRLCKSHPDVEIREELESDLLNILGSPSHLSKAMMNLLKNAIEAMPDGGEVRVLTENLYIDREIRGYDTVIEGEYAVLTISDNGQGIAPEDMERIFIPFYTSKVLERGGTGLGLPVVWGTIKDHNGYITVDSVKDQGTTFRLYFPVTREEVSQESPVFPVEQYMGKGEKILVVDDIEEQRDVVYSLLSKLGYSVSTASSGEEAVEFIRKRPVDLLVLDMIMSPGIDGLETLRRIVELQPHQKAIITSGFFETERVKEALGLGAGCYIRKPYTLGKIGEAVKKELEKDSIQ